MLSNALIILFWLKMHFYRQLKLLYVQCESNEERNHIFDRIWVRKRALHSNIGYIACVIGRSISIDYWTIIDMLSIVIDSRLIVLRLRKMTHRYSYKLFIRIIEKHANCISYSQGHSIMCMHWKTSFKPIKLHLIRIWRVSFVWPLNISNSLEDTSMRSAVYSDLIIETDMKCITRKWHYLLWQ